MTRMQVIARDFGMQDGDEVRINEEGRLYLVCANERMGNLSESVDPVVVRQQKGQLSTTAVGKRYL